MAVSGLSIPVTTPVFINFLYRKTTGGAHNASVGLKVTISGAAPTVFATQVCTTSTNQAENGSARMYLPPYVTNYTSGGDFVISNKSVTADPSWFSTSTDRPNGTITALTILGKVQNAAITLGVDEVYVYTQSTSGGL